MSNFNQNGDTLTHYGILGMKWGVRRSPEELARARGRVDEVSSIVRNAKNINKSANNIRRNATKDDLSKMTDQELREKVNRMNLEQQYVNLSSNTTAKGEAYVRDILDTAGDVLAITSSAIGIALSIYSLKKKG